MVLQTHPVRTFTGSFALHSEPRKVAEEPRPSGFLLFGGYLTILSQSHPCDSIASLPMDEIIPKAASSPVHRRRNDLEAAVWLPKVTSSARAQVHLSGNGEGMFQR